VRVFDSGAVSAVVAVVGLMLTIVALIATWRTSRRSVSTQVYREAAAAWETKSKAQDVENADLRVKLAARDEQVASLNGRVGVLQDTVTGARAWDTLERRTAEMLSLAAETRGDTRRIHESVDAALRELADLGEGCTRILDRMTRHLGDNDEEESR
jgi:hypothetical protein